MGFYHIELTPNLSALCTIVLPWGKYKYLKLPMGLSNSPDIFQEKMGDLLTWRIPIGTDQRELGRPVSPAKQSAN
eukprot:1453367-Ditylum_brightwellii.AAC.1